MRFTRLLAEPLQTLSRPLKSACALGALLLGACASPPPPITEVEMQQAGMTLLNQTVRLQTLVEICRHFDGELNSQARQIADDWLDRNWANISAADNLFSEDLQQQAFKFQGQDLSLPAFILLRDNTNWSQNKIGSANRSRAARKKACEQQLALYLPQPLDPEDENQLATQSALDKLQQNHLSSSERYRVPKLAGQLSPHNKPGRSLYQLEQTVRASHCPQAKLITLHNDWPHEFYGAQCPTGRDLLYHCQWGKCEPLRD